MQSGASPFLGCDSGAFRLLTGRGSISEPLSSALPAHSKSRADLRPGQAFVSSALNCASESLRGLLSRDRRLLDAIAWRRRADALTLTFRILTRLPGHAESLLTTSRCQNLSGACYLCQICTARGFRPPMATHSVTNEAAVIRCITECLRASPISLALRRVRAEAARAQTHGVGRARTARRVAPSMPIERRTPRLN